ncbi:hypothetical protein BDL97_18G006000 [Sphagnum fallax]|nr:hypothetical protein BDL97_18G006000 [Sphagnum fallax]
MEREGTGINNILAQGGGALWRTSVLAKHFATQEEARAASSTITSSGSLRRSACLEYASPESNSERPAFDKEEMRCLLDGHNIPERNFMFNLMASSELFQAKKVGNTIFLSPDYNQPMEEQRDITLARILFLREKGVFKGWLTERTQESDLKRSALFESFGIFDHSLAIKLGVHIHLWGGAIQFFGTKRHHDKWLQQTEDYIVRGCFAMTELGHGSNVRGIETLTTYDPQTEEFIINTPCESAQKYWIGGAAKHATHTVVFSQLSINGRNEGVHAFICQLRDAEGHVCPGIRIADCGHKIGLNGVDNGRIWFDHVRIPRENLLNSVADVTPDGQYESAIKDPDQRFGAFMAPLTSGRVTIAVSAVYQAKLGLATAIRYGLTRRAFSLSPEEPEVLLLDYPSHQHRLLPLLAKTYAMSFAALDLKKLYVRRTPADSKTIHVLSSGLKAMLSWHGIRTLQECREACGGQGLKTDNRVGPAKAEYDVQLTFEGDNNVLMQQVSKALLGDYFAAQRKGKPLEGLGLEHMNGPSPVIPFVLDRNTLRNKNFQLALFQLRERNLLELLSAKVKKFLSKGLSMTDAVIASYQLAEHLGVAFSERTVLESILAAEELQMAGPLKDVLGLLRTLYMLSAVDEGPAFLRYGYLSPAQSQLIAEEVSALCAELRPQALNLVNSFGIPQSLLGPIASDWIEYNSWENV